MCISCRQPSPTVAEGVFEKKDAVTTFDLDDIQQGGELIALTLYGPASYFEWRGEDFGPQYRLADAFGRSIGVSVRVDVCRSEQEMLQRLLKGDGDIVAYHVGVADSLQDEVAFCGEHAITHLLDTLSVVERDRSLRPEGQVAWLVRNNSPQLESALNNWLTQNESKLLAMSIPKPSTHSSSRKGRRLSSGHYSLPSGSARVGASGSPGSLSPIIKRYAHEVGWDWRLLAAQCYQESGFNPQAVSWMGAQGLMQLMPSTARTFGVHDVFDPEQNLRGAAAFIKTLQQRYASIPADERINFILAAYNAGPGHVDDARNLAKKLGRNPDRWQGNVADIVLRMSDATYYNDPVCRHGYFRGSETYNYVADIRERWSAYRNQLQ
ncbi:MAG: transglycosylase SLT domain-containing protein [Bacteroidales bacterium]|nr:transglycosylase SLT domain-containing protein [Bacteroidales bacterium]